MRARRRPTDTYAVAIAVTVSLMLVTLLLAAGHAGHRTLRERLLAARARAGVPGRTARARRSCSSALCAAAVALVMAAFVSLFVTSTGARFELWVLALAFGAAAFGALGVAVGGARAGGQRRLAAGAARVVADRVRRSRARQRGLGTSRRCSTVAFVFPFKAALEATSNAFSGARRGSAPARAPARADARVRRARSGRLTPVRLEAGVSRATGEASSACRPCA